MTARARTKSFTGCWTCRARKIKCDLRQPTCKQCEKAKIQCEGYSVKLRWTGPNGDGKSNDRLRRQVEFAKFPPSMLYETYEELDELLMQLHSSQPSGDETNVAGPFGLFKGFEPPEEELENGLSSRRKRKRRETSAEPTPTPVSLEDDLFSASELAKAGLSGMQHAGGFEADLDDILNSLYTPEPAQVEQQTREHKGLEVLFEPGPFDTLRFVPNYDTYSMSSGPRFLAIARQLLLHYQDEVTPLLTVVVHNRNPWRTIYLPRALSAVGDITVTGITTHARYTCLYSMAATAAFHLRLNYLEKSPGFEYYETLGNKLQQLAKHWLSRCLTGESVGKYKDLLVALLSMTSLDLVKGTDASDNVSLAAAQRLINVRYRTRPRMSRKAKILHRICVVLTLLQKVTAIGPANSLSIVSEDASSALSDGWIDKTFDDVVIPQSQPRSMQELEKLQSRQMPLSYMNDMDQLEEYFSQYSDVNQSVRDELDGPSGGLILNNDYEAVSTPLIHGLTPSLVYIFKQVVAVAHRVLHIRETSGGKPVFSADLIMQSTEVEAQLQAWKPQYLSSRASELLVPEVNDLIRHHALACHEALVVYHYRLTKDVNRALLQPALERVIELLENMNEMNRGRTRPLAVPFMFAGFICGCEVETSNVLLRERYTKWISEMRACGLSTYVSATAVLNEVYRRREANLSSNWWDVTRDWNLSLNLL